MSEPAAERARLFFALWPDAAVQAALANAALEAARECGGRATAADKIHLTLFFVGDLERSRIAPLLTCAQAVAGRAFELDLDTLGYWRHNRIVWGGATRCPPELPALAASITRNLAGQGLREEDRPYVPHATLVRNARRTPAATSLACPTWSAREFVLVGSVRAGGASRYEIIGCWPLSR